MLSKKIKILMFIPSFKGGGAERVFLNLANFFARKTTEVLIITTDSIDYNLEFSDSIKIIKLKTTKLKGLGPGINTFINMVLYLFQVSKQLINIKPDIFFCTLTLSNVLGYLAHKIAMSKSKLVIRQANVMGHEKINKLLLYFLRKTFNNSSLIIANSLDTKESIEKFIYKKKHIEIIGNPIYNKKIEELKKSPIDEKLNGKIYILNVGTLTDQKNHKSLLRAFSYVRKTYDIDLVILGQGRLKDELKKISQMWNIEKNVHFIGFKQNPFPYYYHAQLFVLSSVYEGFGNVIVEALSVGTPVVSTACSGGPSFILENGKYGDLVSPNNDKDLARKIEYRLKNLNEYPATFLIERAKEFSIEKIGQDYLKLLKKISNK